MADFNLIWGRGLPLVHLVHFQSSVKINSDNVFQFSCCFYEGGIFFGGWPLLHLQLLPLIELQYAIKIRKLTLVQYGCIVLCHVVICVKLCNHLGKSRQKTFISSQRFLLCYLFMVTYTPNLDLPPFLNPVNHYSVLVSASPVRRGPHSPGIVLLCSTRLLAGSSQQTSSQKE